MEIVAEERGFRLKKIPMRLVFGKIVCFFFGHRFNSHEIEEMCVCVCPRCEAQVDLE